MNILKINGTALTGIYVDAAVSFNKPAKRVETFSVPGRNGDLVIDEGTFDNVLISYPVYEKSTFPDEFDAIVNWLASLQGYQRIECSNDPNHFRLGRFVVPQTPTAKRLNKDGYYTLTFDCKPQRWLLSGEEDTEITANPSTEYTGDVVTFTANALDEITELKAAIKPVQSGTGDPSPTNIRPISGHTEVNVVRTGVNLCDEEWEDGYITSSGNLAPATNAIRSKNYNPCSPNTQYYYVKGTNTNGYSIAWYDKNKTFISRTSETQSLTSPANAYYFKVSLYNYKSQDSPTYNHDISINYPSTDHDYHAYNGNTYPITLGQTVYGGTLNVTTGVLTITMASVDLGTLNWGAYGDPNYGGLFYSDTVKSVIKHASSEEVYTKCSSYNSVPNKNAGAIGQSSEMPNCSLRVRTADGRLYLRDDSHINDNGSQFTTAMNGVQLVYELKTPTTVQLSATEVTTLLGTNNIWADTGNVTVEVTSGTLFNNPSPFNAKPLIRAYGIGTFRINDNVVTIANHDKPYIDIDCELQECYYEGENMSAYVSFSDNDYPVLIPDDNFVLLATGITKLDVTPRWWIL